MSEKLHELKTWPDPFGRLWAGQKTAEFRIDDRGFKVGHHLVLQEFDPKVAFCDAYTGREIEVLVTDTATGSGIPRPYMMLSFVEVRRTDA